MQMWDKNVDTEKIRKLTYKILCLNISFIETQQILFV